MEIQQYEMESERLRFRRLRADDYALIAPILQDEQTMYAWEPRLHLRRGPATGSRTCCAAYQQGRLRLLRRAGQTDRRAGRACGPAHRAALRGYGRDRHRLYRPPRPVAAGLRQGMRRGLHPLCVRQAGRGARDRRHPAGQPRLAARRGVLQNAGRRRDPEALSGQGNAAPHMRDRQAPAGGETARAADKQRTEMTKGHQEQILMALSFLCCYPCCAFIHRSRGTGT